MALHPSVEERLARLAPDQRAAATAPPGPVLCVAPAGSGKTTTLVARISWLVATGTDPRSITAVTFNKRAADELNERLRAALAPLDAASAEPRVGTFHALGREILEEAGVAVDGLVERSDVLREISGGLLGPGALRRLDDTFSRLKLDIGLDGPSVAAMRTPTSRPPNIPPELLEAFVAYERWLADHRSLDFDDLVARPLRLLEGDVSALTRWRERCGVLLVDEAQDVDRSQLKLALLLSGPAHNVFLVGDDDQTIYAWRLADVRRVLDLAARLPTLRRVDLVTNYRCPQPVVKRAVRLIERNRERFSKTIRARPAATGDVFLAPDAGDELARARRLLAEWYGRAPGLHAVLARTNAELAPYAAVAIEMGIAYQAADDGLLLDDPLVDRLLDEVEASRSTDPPSVTVSRRRENNPVARSLAAWAVPYRTLADLRLALGEARRRRNELRRDDAELVLATAHGTKGLEFDNVACVGLDDGVFPNCRTLAEAENRARALEEERRLAYVAWTRARRSLVLVYDPYAPSVFMTDAFTAEELAGDVSRSAVPHAA